MAVGTAFGLVFLAELPDKTMFASLAMGTRMRPLFVWLGTTTAFAVHVTIAVAAGSVLGLLPGRAVALVSAALFGLGAWWLLRGGDAVADDAGGASPERATQFRAVYPAAFVAVFLSEWGDLTQLTTANLAASAGAVPVAVGAVAALSTVSALALLAGRFIADRVPLRLVARAGGVCMLALAAWSLVLAVRG